MAVRTMLEIVGWIVLAVLLLAVFYWVLVLQPENCADKGGTWTWDGRGLCLTDDGRVIR